MPLFKLLMLIFVLFLHNAFATDAREIFVNNCSSCHILKKGNEITDKDTLLGPPAFSLANKIKRIFNNEEQFIEFVCMYLKNPSKIKARCKSDTIKRFGIMPKSVGDTLSDEDKKAVAKWIYHNINM